MGIVSPKIYVEALTPDVFGDQTLRLNEVVRVGPDSAGQVSLPEEGDQSSLSFHAHRGKAHV